MLTADICQALKAQLEQHHQHGHRLPLVLLGEPDWCRGAALHWLQQSGLDTEAVWYSDSSPDGVKSLPATRINHQLGTDLRAVVVDCHGALNVNALAALAGAVVAGGCFVLLGSHDRFHETVFLRRLWKLVQSHAGFSQLYADGQLKLGTLLGQNNDPLVSASTWRQQSLVAQQQAVAELLSYFTSERTDICLLEGPRGRGKSAAVGLALQQWQPPAKTRVLLTGPRLAATDTLQAFAAASGVGIQFEAPDSLLAAQPPADLVIVEEAAALAPRLIKNLFQRYQKLLLVTTSDGYEGTGQGFVIRMKPYLANKNLVAIQLQLPMRWADQDPLERWLQQLICHSGPDLLPLPTDSLELAKVSLHPFDYELESGKQQDQNRETALQQIYQLLALAHYRTQPSFLQWLLDDPDRLVFGCWYQGVLVGVVAIAEEGPLPSAIQPAIMQGQRRPKGHRLPQSIAVHGHLPPALDLRCWRIVRIAVHPNFQGQGLGSLMVTQVVQLAKQRELDIVGTLFAVDQRILPFWQRQKLALLRLGLQAETTTGNHSALMAMGINSAGERAVQHMASGFGDDFPLRLMADYQGLATPLVIAISNKLTTELALRGSDQQAVQRYLSGASTFDNVAPSLWRYFWHHCSGLSWETVHPQGRILIVQRLLQKKPWSSCCEAAQLPGVKAANRELLIALQQLLSNLQ